MIYLYMEYGIVYLLIYPVMPNLVKIENKNIDMKNDGV